MGTRATFWIGDPRTPEREFLGSVGWDGYPGGLPNLAAESVDTFRQRVEVVAGERDDWDGAENGFPFPWVADIFLTDYTYAFFGERTQVTSGHCGFQDYPDQDGESESIDPSLVNIGANMPWRGLAADDSIIVIGPRS